MVCDSCMTALINWEVVDFWVRRPVDVSANRRRGWWDFWCQQSRLQPTYLRTWRGHTHTQSQGKVKMPLQKLCALWQLMLFKAAVCDKRLERWFARQVHETENKAGDYHSYSFKRRRMRHYCWKSQAPSEATANSAGKGRGSPFPNTASDDEIKHAHTCVHMYVHMYVEPISVCVALSLRSK